MKENISYKNEALAALKGNWAQAVLALLIIFACTGFSMVPMFRTIASDINAMAESGGSGDLLTYAVCIFLVVPLQFGYVYAMNSLLTAGEGRIVSNMFGIAFKRYLHKLWAMILRAIYIFLWSLLLLIPGIIKSLSYAMTVYIVEDYPELSANQAIDLSREMMKDRKFDLFYLYLSFAGWFILCIFTLGIGYLWLQPYIYSAQAAFYQDVKADYFMRKNMQNDGPAAQEKPSAPVQAVEPDIITPAPRKEENPEDYMPK